MKRLRLFGAIAALLLAFAAGAYANEGMKRVDAYVHEDIRLQLNERDVVLTDPLLLYEGRSYLPVRALSLLLGHRIDWDGDERIIQISDKTTVTPSQPKVEKEPVRKQPYPNSVYQEKLLRYEQIFRYDMTWGNIEDRPVFMNRFEGVMYARVSDLLVFDLDWRDVPIYAEEATDEAYVSVEELQKVNGDIRATWKQRDVPIITNEPSEKKRKALETQQSALYIHYLSDTNQYMALFENPKGNFYINYLELRSSNNTNGWSTSFKRQETLYKKEDDKTKQK